MTAANADLRRLMEQSVHACIAHVDTGGLPFVGVVADASGHAVSNFGVNRVAETSDPTAHAEIVAMRDAMTAGGLDTLAGTLLLATGEPCGLCYRYAIDHGVEAIVVAADRDEVASFGIDYLATYRAFGITNTLRAELFHSLPIEGRAAPFVRYLHNNTSRYACGRRGTSPKGTPS